MVPEVWHRALLQVRISGNKHLVLNAIAYEQLRLRQVHGRRFEKRRFREVEDLEAVPIGDGHIAKITGLQPKVVWRERRALVQLGMIDVTPQAGDGDGHRQNLIRILPPSRWKVAFAPAAPSQNRDKDFSKLGTEHLNSEGSPPLKTEETSEIPLNNLPIEVQSGRDEIDTPSQVPSGRTSNAGTAQQGNDRDGEASKSPDKEIQARTPEVTLDPIEAFEERLPKPVRSLLFWHSNTRQRLDGDLLTVEFRYRAPMELARRPDNLEQVNRAAAEAGLRVELVLSTAPADAWKPEDDFFAPAAKEPAHAGKAA
jgi:hypothetical protein